MTLLELTVAGCFILAAVVAMVWGVTQSHAMVAAASGVLFGWAGTQVVMSLCVAGLDKMDRMAWISEALRKKGE